MQLISRNQATLFFALGAVLIAAWLASAATADAASSKFHITSLESKKALELAPTGKVVEATPNSSSLRQQWIQLNQPGGTALYGNVATAGTKCLAAPADATPTSVNSLAIRSCSSILDKRLHWTRKTGVPFNSGLWMFNAHTGQVLMPQLCIVGPCSNEPSLAPANFADAFGTFAEWQFKFIGSA
jgi:hypothetical protein